MGPTQELVFLGIRIVSHANPALCRLSLDALRVQSYLQLAQDCMSRLGTPDALCYQEYESLLGKLTWIAGVLPAGRIRTTCIWKALPRWLNPRAPIRIDGNK
jgi:hypothetical protein